jgi:hypothetical protein
MPSLLRTHRRDDHGNAVLMPVVTMSSRRPNIIIVTVPIPVNAAMPTGVKGKNQGSES